MTSAEHEALDATLKTVCDFFKIKGEYIACRQVENGNVNRTYIVDFRRQDGPKEYIVQRVNTYAFRNVEQLMSNIDLVTEHLRMKRPDMRNLHFHHTAERKTYVEYDGGAWRLSNFLPSVTFNTCTDAGILRSAGAAFGDFQMQLMDFDAAKLYETIPDFHDTRKRLDKLLADAARDELGRAAEAREELDYIRAAQERACTLVDMLHRGELPLRVTHNDTKINNVLFDAETKEPICVIDLDTVMPGLVGADFGDAVRFACSTAEEDCPDVSKVAMDLALFRAYAEGFLKEVGRSLTQAEVDTLALSGYAIAVELASRFLDDYLLGDKYFKVYYPGHNLVRTRCQLALAKDMMAKMEQMDAIVKEYV